jgi:membrane-associated phospholipid phosphatase
MHPAFPSGHSFLGHFVALLLLEIPALAQRFGVFDANSDGKPGRRPKASDLAGLGEIPSPLLWLSQRLAKNRERLGVHYPSDSSGSRHIAAGLWQALRPDNPNTQPAIVVPSLDAVMRKAAAEWT